LIESYAFFEFAFEFEFVSVFLMQYNCVLCRNKSAEQVLRVSDDLIHAIRSQKSAYKLLTHKPDVRTIVIRPRVFISCAVVCHTQFVTFFFFLSNQHQVYIVARTESIASDVTQSADFVKILAGVANLTVTNASEKVPKGCTVSILSKDLECHLMLLGLVDFSKEIEKMEKQKELKETSIDKLQKTMALPGYATKAPPEKVDQDKAKLNEMQTELNVILQTIADLQLLLNA
jgi:hypothetical protein